MFLKFPNAKTFHASVTIKYIIQLKTTYVNKFVHPIVNNTEHIVFKSEKSR